MSSWGSSANSSPVKSGLSLEHHLTDERSTLVELSHKRETSSSAC
jgi:hypothetical protein